MEVVVERILWLTLLMVVIVAATVWALSFLTRASVRSLRALAAHFRTGGLQLLFEVSEPVEVRGSGVWSEFRRALSTGGLSLLYTSDGVQGQHHETV